MAMGGRAPSGEWWQDTSGKWHEGGQPEALPSTAPLEPLPVPLPRRSKQWSISRVLGVAGGCLLVSNAVLWFLVIAVAASPASSIVLGLLLSFLVGAAALCVLLTRSPRLVISFESLAAIGAAGALTLIALHSMELHHVEGGAGTTQFDENWSFLYVVWALGGAMFAAGAILALRDARR
jgi:hypothetical protein